MMRWHAQCMADDTEGVKNVQMEGKEQEFESTNEVSYSCVNKCSY